MWGVFFCGLCMGAADIVPGVSGGTMAFILGYYEQLIQSIKNLSWKFLLILIAGIAVSMVLLANVIDTFLNDEIYRIFLYSGFTGLILGSVVFCSKQLKKWESGEWLSLIIGLLFAFFLTGSNHLITSSETVFDVELSRDFSGKRIRNYRDQKLLNVPESTLGAMFAKGIVTQDTVVYNHHLNQSGRVEDYVNPINMSWISLWIIICGGIAVCALLLPGISGSYLLNVLGMYAVVVGALADFIKTLDFDAFLILLNLGIGIILGALLFSRLISWLLKHYHSQTLALLIGFMIGALRAVWPFWTYEYELYPLKLEKGPRLMIVDPILPDIFSSIFWIALVIAFFGFILVIILETITTQDL